MDLLLRGPLAISLAVGLLLIPLLQDVSGWTLLQILVLIAACALTVYDAFLLSMRHVRSTAVKALNRIVLQDVLCALFHPETGLIAVSATFFTGNAMMYWLPTNQDQRVTLVQQGFGLPSESAARKVLEEPGGYLTLLPHDLQKEVIEETVDIYSASPHVAETLAKDTSRESKAPPCGEVSIETVDSDDDEAPEISAAPTSTSRSYTTSTGTKRTIAAKPPPTINAVLQEVAQSVLSSQLLQARRKLECVTRSLPYGVVDLIAVVSAALLARQVRRSPSMQRAMAGSFDAIALLGSASVFLGSVSALWMKYSDSEMTRRCKVVGKSIVCWVKRMLATNHVSKGVIAILVLAYFRRRRIQT